jgi:hypothetical protein
VEDRWEGVENVTKMPKIQLSMSLVLAKHKYSQVLLELLRTDVNRVSRVVEEAENQITRSRVMWGSES